MATQIMKKHGYDVGEEIEGQNSKLFGVISPDGEDHVIKVKKNPNETKSKFMFQEREILEKLKGQEVIINLEDVFADGPMIFYCFKLCKYHSLESFLTSGFARHVREPTMNHLCKQLCEALKIVHENDIVHGEIHPEKILVVNKYKNDEKVLLFDIKLAGFGRAIFVNRVSEIHSVKKLINKPMFYSPERMEGTYCQAGDMWAAGILLFQLAWGYMPYKGDKIDELADNILNTEFDPRKDSDEEGPWFCSKGHPIDDFGKQLIGNMLQHKVEDRYAANECLEHTWLNGNRHPWLTLLKHFHDVKIRTKHLKLNFHIGCILIAYLPKRRSDLVKDFQHIYLNRRTDNGKMQTSAEFQKIIGKFGGKLSTEQTEKLFNTFNAFENGVGANEILSAMAVDYMCENDDIQRKFCHHLEHMCDASHMLTCLFHLAGHHGIECNKEEMTKEFDEVFSGKTVELEEFTVQLFGFHAEDNRRITQDIDNDLQESMNFDDLELEAPASYLVVTAEDIAIDKNVACDDKIELILEKQEKEGKRNLFKEVEKSDSESDGESDKNICEKLCACFF